MDLAHLHLILNHFPTIGFIIGLGVFVLGLIGKSDDLKRSALAVFLGIALLSIPIYISGYAAQQRICQAPPDQPCSDATLSATVQSGGAGYASAPVVTFSGGGCKAAPEGVASIRAGAVRDLKLAYMGFGCTSAPQVAISGGGGSGASATVSLSAEHVPVSKSMIETHESAALGSLAFMELTGAFAWLGLWQFRRNARLSRASSMIVLLLSLLTFGLMARTSNLGGDIRHAEIRDAQETAAAQTPSEQQFARSVGALMAGGKQWAWPVCETLHFIGLCLLFGIAAVVDLRVLGWMKGISFSTLHRLLPWGILGFGVNLVTGMLFFVADPGQYLPKSGYWGGNLYGGAFEWKMVLILLAGLNMLYFTVFDTPWHLKAGDDAPMISKLIAASALVMVFGVMFCGRMLPFLDMSF
jgi:uncharacterized membrane protein